MSIDYLIVFNEGEYQLNEDEFKENLVSQFPDVQVGASVFGDDDQNRVLEWTYGTGEGRVDGRAADDLSAVFIHARSSELGEFVEWIRLALPSDVRVLLTNESYSFDLDIPIGATAEDVTGQL